MPNEIKQKVDNAKADLRSGKITEKEYWKIVTGIEERDCKHFHDHSGDGFVNTCMPNIPYSCVRSKSEGLCKKDE